MASLIKNKTDIKKFSKLKAVIYIKGSDRNETVTVTAWDKKNNNPEIKISFF